MLVCIPPHMYADMTRLCHRLNPVKERPCVHHNDLDTFLPCNGSALLQRCSGLLTERDSREMLPPQDASLPACLGLAGLTPPEWPPQKPRRAVASLSQQSQKQVPWFLYPSFNWDISGMHDIMTVCCSPKVWWKIWLSMLAELLCGSSAGTCCKVQLSTVSTGKTRAASLSLQPEETAFFHFDFFHRLLHPYIRACMFVCISSC